MAADFPAIPYKANAHRASNKRTSSPPASRNMPTVGKWLFCLIIVSILTAIHTSLLLNTMDEGSSTDPWLDFEKIEETDLALKASKTTIDSSTSSSTSTFYRDDDNENMATPVDLDGDDDDADANEGSEVETNTDADSQGEETHQQEGDDDDDNNSQASNQQLEPASTPSNTTTVTNTAQTSTCNGFEHGDNTPLSDVTSIFNCGSSSGKCHWFFPSKFLDTSCGIGKEFTSQLNRMKELFDSNELWTGGPPIVLPSASIVPENMVVNPFRDGPWPKHNISMIHVHKTAGTSLVIAFAKVLKKGAQGKRLTLYLPKKKSAKEEQTGSNESDWKHNTNLRKPAKTEILVTAQNKYIAAFNESSAFLDHAVKYRQPDEWGEKDHTIFAVVRDPVDRFVSAIGQATGAPGSTTNGIGKQLLDACLKETSKKTLNCFIELMHSNSTWIEVHFTPMLLEIAFATINKDIPVEIFPFKEVPNLLVELGSNPAQKKKDGKASNYRKSEVLTNMSVNDYDDDMLKRLCSIYKMDALFMNHIGMTTKCDRFMALI